MTRQYTVERRLLLHSPTDNAAVYLIHTGQIKLPAKVVVYGLDTVCQDLVRRAIDDSALHSLCEVTLGHVEDTPRGFMLTYHYERLA